MKIAIKANEQASFDSLYAARIAATTVFMLKGMELAIFSYFPGVTELPAVQNTEMLFVMALAVLYAGAFIAGFGHEHRRKQADAGPIF